MHTPLIGPVGPPHLHLMTWNVRRRLPRLPGSRDAWARRRAAVRAVLAAESPTVLGVQEALEDQAQWVLDSLGPGYRMVGHGRDARGGDEGTPLVYDARRLHLERWAQHALSETPEVPGSRSWGNLFPRTMVEAELTDRATGHSLSVVNLHLDHLSESSRIASARQVRRLASARVGPTVVMGDANSRPGSATWDELTRGGGLQDAWALGRRLTPPWGTLSNYRQPRIGRRIDWMVVGHGIAVQGVGVNAARPSGVAGSDHEPVQAVVTLHDVR